MAKIKIIIGILIVGIIFIGGLWIWKEYFIYISGPKPIPQEVTITTDKTEYEQGETVKIKARNNLDKDICYFTHAGSDCYRTSYTVYQFSNGEWQSLRTGDPYIVCIQVVLPPVCEKLIKSNESLEFTWNQKIMEDICPEYKNKNQCQSPSGKYKISLKIGDLGEIYSNEFTIKEKEVEETEKLTLEELENAEYYSSYYDNRVQLVDGKYEAYDTRETFPLFAGILSDKVAFADLNNDGKEDATVIFYSSGGGSGNFYELVIMMNQDGKPVYLTSAKLGDRVRTISLDIQSGEIILNIIVHAPFEAMCCPTVKTVFKYRLSKNQLLETPDEAIQKREIEQIHLNNLKYFLEGDVVRYKMIFSENYIDWGSGPMKITLEMIKELFEKEEFKRIQGSKPEEVVDLDKKIVLSYSEILKSEAYKEYEGRYGFHFQEGDVLIFFPPKKGEISLLDGFLGIYRKENGIWKIVMSD